MKIHAALPHPAESYRAPMSREGRDAFSKILDDGTGHAQTHDRASSFSELGVFGRRPKLDAHAAHVSRDGAHGASDEPADVRPERNHEPGDRQMLGKAPQGKGDSLRLPSAAAPSPAQDKSMMDRARPGMAASNALRPYIAAASDHAVSPPRADRLYPPVKGAARRTGFVTAAEDEAGLEINITATVDDDLDALRRRLVEESEAHGFTVSDVRLNGRQIARIHHRIKEQSRGD